MMVEDESGCAEDEVSAPEECTDTGATSSVE